MTVAYSEQQQQSALADLKSGKSVEQVVESTGIPLGRLRKWAKAAGLLPRVRAAGGGRKPALDNAGLEILRALIETNGKLTLDELAAAFAEQTQKTLSSSTVAKAMHQLGYRKMKLKRAPSTPSPQTPPRYGPQHRREPTADGYPSALTDAEWLILKPLLTKKDGRGRPPTHDKRELLDAVFYQVRVGNQWRYLPKDFPKWPTVWSFFRRLRDSGTLERLLDELHKSWRQRVGRSEEPSAGIVDSQSVKTTEKGGLFAVTTPAKRSKGASATWSSMSRDIPAQS